MITTIVMALTAMFLFGAVACGNTEVKVEPSATPEPTPSATPEPTPEPTPTQTPEPTPEPQGPGLVAESEKVDQSYFDDTAFVGDSVSLKLNSDNVSSGSLGKAQFFTVGSLGCANALWEVSDKSVHPSYQGEKMLVEDCVAKSGAKKLYIMLGMNDLGVYGIDKTIENYKTLLGKILEKTPDIKIYVQSMTPMTSTSQIIGKNLNNENIKKYNEKLLEMCEENGWYFIDVASVMYDESGETLNSAYCSDPDDMGVHFTEKGCEKWVDYLYTHTAN